MHAHAAPGPVFAAAWQAPFRMDETAPPAAAPLPLPDAGLQHCLLAVAEQDEAAFARLYQALAPRVLQLAQRILRNTACAEEVVEDCFWQVWRQASRFDPARGCAEAWVLTLARSRALDAWRARERQRALSLDALADSGQTIAEPEDARQQAEQLLDASRHQQRLHQALLALKPEARQLLALAFFRGLTHEEIAEQTGLALGTVKSQIRRALATLNPLLGDSNMSTEKELLPDRDALGEALPDALRRAGVPGEAAALLLALTADTRQPSAALGRRLQQRVAASRAAQAAMTTRRKPCSDTPESLADGVMAWPLHGSSRLLELQSGSRWTLPVAPQELLLLDGELLTADTRLAGLQHRVLAGGQTLQALSPCRLYLRSHAFGPFSTLTPAGATSSWQPLREGVEICPLHAEGGAISLLARFAAGASVPAHGHGIAEECLMVEGELFLGDLLLPEGGFQAAPAGSRHGELFADSPCLLFFHGAIDAAAIDNGHRAQLGWPAL